LALADDGTMWTWGYNGHGLLGDGTYTDRPYPGQVAGLTDVVSVSSSLWRSAALREDGTV